jgi:pimeloyl-ACP methyl ester carboxylesterase
VLAIDYRGFGHSTGNPTEEGLILDASAAVDWAMHVAGVSADRIVLLGQSLGTAVTSAVAERYASQGVDFAGVVLVSGFSSLPAMLSDYAIAGFVPVLRPLKIIPPLLRFVLGYIADDWQSADRLKEMVRAVKGRGGRLRLSLIHAKNDWDIPCREDNKLFAHAVNGTVDDPAGIDPETLEEEKERRTVDRGIYESVTIWKDGGIEIRQDLFPYGGESNRRARMTLAMAPNADIFRPQRHHDVRTGHIGCIKSL